MALTIKKKWLDLILAGTKTWEIRGTSTKKRGFIHFAESGSGQLRGRAKLVDCRQLDRCTLMKHQCFHQLPNAEMVKYKNIWAWILKDAEPYEMPFDYSHKQGAVIFVTVRKRMGPQRSAEVEPANSPALQGTCDGGKGCEGPQCSGAEVEPALQRHTV